MPNSEIQSKKTTPSIKNKKKKKKKTILNSCAFVCFVWLSQQTTIISLDDIEQLVFIMQKHCVFREVEAAFLYIIYINLGIYE
jgi:hypothetical protein